MAKKDDENNEPNNETEKEETPAWAKSLMSAMTNLTEKISQPQAQEDKPQEIPVPPPRTETKSEPTQEQGTEVEQLTEEQAQTKPSKKKSLLNYLF